ncbi:hypothetical protein NQZ68_033857 [Dissostichus eleginoides]|nr:hypothetical protein NQZ68_033857 [Dissostichus eleginoides]
MTLEEEREEESADPNEGHKERQRAGGGDYGLLADRPQFGDRHTLRQTHTLRASRAPQPAPVPAHTLSQPEFTV